MGERREEEATSEDSASSAPIPDAQNIDPADKEPVAAQKTSALAKAIAPEAHMRRSAGLISAAAALLWVPQAYALAAVLAEAAQPGAGWSVGVGLPVFLAAAALRAGLSAAAVERAGSAAEAAKVRIRGAIAEAAAAWAPLDANRPAPGRVAALIGDMVESVGPYLTSYEPARRRVEIVPLTLLVATFTLSWAVGLLFLVALPLIPLAMAMIGRAAQRASDAQLREVSSLSARLVERLRALSDVRLLGAAGRDAAAFEAEADDLRSRTMSVLRLAFLSSAVLEAIAALGVALTAIYVGLSLVGRFDFGVWTDAPLSLRSGLFLLLLAPSFFQPLREFGAAYHDRASAEAFAERLNETLQADAALMPGRTATPRRLNVSESPVIRLQGLAAAGFAPIDFEIAPGDAVAVIGPSGAGKSTLLSCLAALREPESGRILIGSDELSDETAEDWRRRIAWIGQRPHLVSGSMRANVAFYDPGAARDDERLEAAIKAASAERIVERAPRGLASPVGETAGGVSAGVSGGEARRLGVARLAFADRNVVLADEPTADLDIETATAVTDGLLRSARGRTLIVATHDPALIERLERRIELKVQAK